MPDHNPLEFLMNLSNHGDVASYDTPYGKGFLINHPDLIGQIFHSANYVRGSLMKMSLGEGLLASEGPYWRRQRRAMQPVFHQQSVSAFIPIITNTTIRAIQRWRTYEDPDQSIDVASEMTWLTLCIISEALFGTSLGEKADHLCKAINRLTEHMGRFACSLFTSPHHLSPSDKYRFEEALQTVNRFANEIINSHRKNRSGKSDLISLLLSGDDDGNEGLDDRQLRDEVVTMLLAGHVTSTNMLVWTWCLLAEHPAVRARLDAELAQVLDGRLPTAQDISKLRYTRMILQESLRLYPPVWFIARKALADDEIGGCRIPANAAVVVSPYTMHRHSGFWEKPEQFDPTRFSEELCEGRARNAYLPFGGGHHLCIGIHLAMLEGQLVLATMAQSYRLHLVPGQSVEPDPVLTLRAPSGLKMKLEPRPELPSHV